MFALLRGVSSKEEIHCPSVSPLGNLYNAQHNWRHSFLCGSLLLRGTSPFRGKSTFGHKWGSPRQLDKRREGCKGPRKCFKEIKAFVYIDFSKHNWILGVWWWNKLGPSWSHSLETASLGSLWKQGVESNGKFCLIKHWGKAEWAHQDF